MRYTYTTNISENWMITIPKEIIEKYDISEGDTVIWIPKEDYVILKFKKRS